jgi:hypothetical protein
VPTRFSNSNSPVSALHCTNLYSSSSVSATLLHYFLPFFVTPCSPRSIFASLHYPFPGNGFITLSLWINLLITHKIFKGRLTILQLLTSDLRWLNSPIQSPVRCNPSYRLSLYRLRTYSTENIACIINLSLFTARLPSNKRPIVGCYSLLRGCVTGSCVATGLCGTLFYYSSNNNLQQLDV